MSDVDHELKSLNDMVLNDKNPINCEYCMYTL